MSVSKPYDDFADLRELLIEYDAGDYVPNVIHRAGEVYMAVPIKRFVALLEAIDEPR